MSLPSSIEDDDPTVSDLFVTDRRLGILCAACGRFRYLNSSRFEGDRKVSALGANLTCSTCGSKDVKAVVVSRSPENGYWPAEHS